MKKKDVCISGLGLITPLGTGVEKFWENLLSGKTAIRSVDIFKFPVDPQRPELRRTAPLDFAPVKGLDETLPEALYWGDRLLLHATQMAIEDAGLNSLPPSSAVIIGGGASSILNIEEYEQQLALDIAENMPLSKLPMGIASSEQIIANRFGLSGPKMSITTACSSSAHAIGYACDLLRMGKCELAVCGAVNTLSQLTHSGFYGLKSIDPDRSRPFDEKRNGISIGEAAVMLILEPAESVLTRGHEPYCTIEGYAANCDAKHMTAPDESGEVFWQLMKKTLEDASISSQDVDYICAHGTGTMMNDLAEARAISVLFGEAPLVTSIKGAVGHCMEGAGALNCATCALVLKTGVLPPNTGMHKQDERCRINIPVQPAEKSCDIVLANAFAFGGNNVSIVLQKWNGSRGL